MKYKSNNIKVLQKRIMNELLQTSSAASRQLGASGDTAPHLSCTQLAYPHVRFYNPNAGPTRSSGPRQRLSGWQVQKRKKGTYEPRSPLDYNIYDNIINKYKNKRKCT